MIRRRAGQPRQVKQTSNTVLDTLGVSVPRAQEAPPRAASLVAVLAAGLGPYVGPLRPGPPGLAAIRQAGRIPLLPRDAGGDGHRQRTGEEAYLRH